jgi:hypothetical protein
MAQIVGWLIGTVLWTELFAWVARALGVRAQTDGRPAP